MRLNVAAIEPLLHQAFLLFLLLVGFAALHRPLGPSGLLAANALPQRGTARQEWLQGAALGWALILIAALPMMLVGALHPQFWLAPRAWGLTVISIAALLLGSLAVEVAFRGFLFARLTALLGPVTATVVLALLYAFTVSGQPNATMLALVVAFISAFVYSVAYLRTHALWLGWGLRFAFAVVTAMVLGLPVQGDAGYSTVVSTDTSGANWLSGGPFGPTAALFTAAVFLAALPVLYRITRDYAWAYTHPEILPAGMPVVIAPPAAHTAMEAAAAPAPLVQILGSTPTAPSTMPVIEEHLRRPSDPE